MTPLIETRELTKVYGVRGHRVTALDHLSCAILRGSWTTITGPSGSGKSTLLSLMAALDRPTSGRVLVEGNDISFCSDWVQARYRKTTIGIVFQEYHLFEQLTGLENVAMVLVVTNLNRGQRMARAQQLLGLVGLAERGRHLPRQLSGGERQRLAIARSLAHDPEIIFADEPLSNIDEAAQVNILSIFRELLEKGKTLVIVSHDPKIADMSDQVIRLRGGRRVEEEP